MKPHIEVLFTAIFKNLKMNGTLAHYLRQIENSEDYKFLILKRGIRLVDMQEDYVVHPTTYEVWLNMKENELIYVIGNLEVYKERYRSTELLKIFQDESIISINEPDPIDVERYLSVVHLLNPQIPIGEQARIDQIVHRIKEGEVPTGRYFEEKDDGYYFLEITEENSEIIMKKMFCPSLNHIIYALASGGDLKIEGKNLNKKIYETIRYKFQQLATEFNKEVLMSLISIEYGIDDYNELLNKVKQL